MNTGETIALIKALGKGGGGGGSSLPSVTSADNGKVLTVDDGAWAADSNLFLVTVTGTTSDKSRSEILDAIEKGRSVVLIKGTSRFFPSGQDNSYIYFINETKIANDRYLNVIAVNESKFATADKLYMLPCPSSSDNGKELIINNSSIVYQAKKFIVTLTPTAVDYSGTMDKTIAEINAAYVSGKEIWFSMDDGTGLTYNVLCDDVLVDSSYTYPSFGSKVIVVLMNALVYLFTGTTNDGTGNTYSTAIYPLESSGGGVLVIHETVSGGTHTLDKTWQEIHDADLPVFIIDNPDGGGTMRLWITNIAVSDDRYNVSVDGIEYSSGTESGYPEYTE